MSFMMVGIHSKPDAEPPTWPTLPGLLKKSVGVNPKEMRVFNVVESREATLPNGKIVQKLRQ